MEFENSLFLFEKHLLKIRFSCITVRLHIKITEKYNLNVLYLLKCSGNRKIDIYL